jgi:DNA-binding CsgD family transcriptional regulator
MSHSAQPTLAELRALFRLLGDLRELSADRLAWRQRMVNGLCGLLGARQGSALGLDGFHPGGSMRLIDAVHGGWANPVAAAIWENQLRSGEFRNDSLLIEAQKTPDPVCAVLRAELVPDATFYASPIVQELLPVLGIDSHVVGWQRMPSGKDAVALTFHRERGAREFGLKERAMLRLFIEELHQLRLEGKLGGVVTADAPKLSRREREVLARLLTGESVKEAAGNLRLSARTVEDYVKSLYRKHGVHSRAELLARFVKTQA